MQEASKVAATLGVTFAVGVLTGWLLNSYTRKGLEGMLNKLQNKVKRI